MDERPLAPGLLLAMPQLPDPNFFRAVVLMVEHSADGSWGLVVNRPTELLVADVLKQLEIAWQGPADLNVWQGGPVETYRGCVIHSPQAAADAEAIVPGLALSTLPDQLESLADQPPPGLRFLLGYAGWGPGQLEREMAEGAWLLAPVEPELIFDNIGEEMWEAAIASLGVDLSTLVPAGGVH